MRDHILKCEKCHIPIPFKAYTTIYAKSPQTSIKRQFSLCPQCYIDIYAQWLK